jgi:hypothetical protein
MQAHTIKTTLTFSPTFWQRLRMVAQAQQRSVSRFVEEELDTLLHQQEQKKLERLYQALKKWQGTGSPQIIDASTTIDETLYGEQGAWKGQRE